MYTTRCSHIPHNRFLHQCCLNWTRTEAKSVNVAKMTHCFQVSGNQRTLALLLLIFRVLLVFDDPGQQITMCVWSPFHKGIPESHPPYTVSHSIDGLFLPILKLKHSYGDISSRGECLISISISMERQQSSATPAFNSSWFKCMMWTFVGNYSFNYYLLTINYYLFLGSACNLSLFVHEAKHKRSHSLDLCSYRIMALTLVQMCWKVSVSFIV